MKARYVLFIAVAFVHFSTQAQERKSNFFVSPAFYFAAHNPFESNTTGYGMHFGVEHYFSKNFSGTASIGYIYFKGDFVDFDGNTKNHFALVPLTIGVSYHVKSFFASFETGPAIKASDNTKTRLAFIPGVGVTMKKFDFGFKLFGVPETSYGIPEQSVLQRGGYSYFQLCAAYHL